MNNYLIYGIHTIKALLEHDPERILDIYMVNGRNNLRRQPLMQQLDQAGIIVQIVKRNWLDEKMNGAVHQGIVARVRARLPYQEKELPALLSQHAAPLLLVLDGVTDPHNLGACLRCADAAGVHAVIVPRYRSAPLNATAQKVASGAAEMVPIVRVTNLVNTIRLLQEHNVWIVGTAATTNTDGGNLYQSTLTTSPLALVIGDEGEGLRRRTSEHCNEIISIPMCGSVSSLNVSVAVGICLFEAVRQRRYRSFADSSRKK